MKTYVEFVCEDCGAVGDGFRDSDELESEECWGCGGPNYGPSTTEDE